ncbi:MAG: hypothetical protein IPK50_23400 [Fibrobacterota bacterium]|nr:hypothetical protein [Fibrobacterota bacterium]QQS05180.1 MAG: hypothetical protein IPK50_23400 [Fibrobacterota bacterium]
MKIRFLLAATCASLFMQSCAYRYTALPTMTLAGPALKKDSFRPADFQLTEKNVESTDDFSIIVFFPMIGDNQKLFVGMIDNAVQKICKEKNYAFMTNVRVYVKQWYIPMLYGKVEMSVRGEGWTATQKAEIIDGLKSAGYQVSLVSE